MEKDEWRKNDPNDKRVHYAATSNNEYIGTQVAGQSSKIPILSIRGILALHDIGPPDMGAQSVRIT